MPIALVSRPVNQNRSPATGSTFGVHRLPLICGVRWDVRRRSRFREP